MIPIKIKLAQAVPVSFLSISNCTNSSANRNCLHQPNEILVRLRKCYFPKHPKRKTHRNWAKRELDKQCFTDFRQLIQISNSNNKLGEVSNAECVFRLTGVSRWINISHFNNYIQKKDTWLPTYRWIFTNLADCRFQLFRDKNRQLQIKFKIGNSNFLPLYPICRFTGKFNLPILQITYLFCDDRRQIFLWHFVYKEKRKKVVQK